TCVKLGSAIDPDWPGAPIGAIPGGPSAPAEAPPSDVSASGGSRRSKRSPARAPGPPVFGDDEHPPASAMNKKKTAAKPLALFPKRWKFDGRLLMRAGSTSACRQNLPGP